MINLTPFFIASSIIALLIIAILVFFVKKNKKHEKISILGGLSFGFIIAGIVFSNERIICYSLIGIGVIIAVIDIIIKMKSRKK
jgi:hypothetical protein